MFQRWRRQWQARQEAAALRRRAIADDLWKRTRVRYPFLQRRDPADEAELRRLTSLFLDRKEFSAVGGLVLTDAMAVAIAAQAVLPVLRLGLAAYDGFVGIVVHPDQVVARREVADEDGIVHEYDEVLAGESMEGGPVMLSWQDVRAAGGADGMAYNVVIHEFAHVLDGTNGEADGMPLLPAGLSVTQWRRTLGETLQRLRQAEARGARSVIDTYGAQGEEECFAVASEAFFVSPAALRREDPALYALLGRYYGQDPAEEMPAATPSGSGPRRRGA